MRVLPVEDEQSLAEYVAAGLRKLGGPPLIETVTGAGHRIRS